MVLIFRSIDVLPDTRPLVGPVGACALHACRLGARSPGLINNGRDGRRSCVNGACGCSVSNLVGREGRGWERRGEGGRG